MYIYNIYHSLLCFYKRKKDLPHCVFYENTSVFYDIRHCKEGSYILLQGVRQEMRLGEEGRV